MANSSEIADIQAINKELIIIDGSVNKLSSSCLNLTKTFGDSINAVKGVGVTLEMVTKAQKEAADGAKQLDSIGKQLAASEQKLKETEDGRMKTIIENRVATQAATQAIKDKVKAEQAEEGSLVRMRDRLKELTTAYDKAGTRTKEAAKEIDNLSREIGKAEEETNRHSRGVGGYRDQLGSLTKGLATGTISVAAFGAGIVSMGKAALAWLLTPVGMIVAAIGMLVMAGKALIDTSKDFQRAGSSLSAITGAVGDDLEFMKDKAREFAKESESSATEILVAFEKVGSKLPELLKNGPLLAEVSRNAIILSESTQGKLSVEDAAVAAAEALNAFSIPLTDSARAVNTLAAASLAGGAEVMDLVDSFKNLAPVAVAANMSLEQSAAALEVLEKFQLKAEKGGMQLKGSLLQLQSAGLGFASGQFNINDALIEAETLLNKIVDPIKRAAEQEKIFGRENMTAGLIMMNNRQQFIDLTTTIEDQVKKGTIAQDMAKTANDNLQGSYNKFSNGWKGLLLQLEDGDGVVMKVWRRLVDFGTWILNVNEVIFKGIGKVFDIFKSKKDILAREDKKIADDKALNDKAAADKAAKLAAGQAAIEESARKKKEEDDKKSADKKEKADKKLADAEQKKVNDYVENRNKEIKADEDAVKTKLKLIEDEDKDREDLTKKVTDDTAKEIEAFSKKWEEKKAIEKDAFDAKLKQAEEYNDKQKEIENDLLQTKREFTQQAVDTIFSINADANNKKLEQLETEKNNLLDNDKLTKNQRAQIEAEYQKKEDAIKKKQKIANKIQSAIEVGIKTAQTIFAIQAQAAVLTSNPLTIALAPMALAQIPWVLGMAGLSLAAIAKFKSGTLNAPSRGIFGEEGRELMFPVGGGVIIADKPTYFSGDRFKGAQIINNDETKRLMSLASDKNMIIKNQSDPKLLDQMKRIEKAILNKPVAIYDKNHKQIGLGNSNHQTIYINRLTRE